MRHIAKIAVIAMLLLCASCGSQPKSVERPARAVYFWNTKWQPGSEELAFLREHKVKKLYIRYFDLVRDSHERVVPNATITFGDSVPSEFEVVPTIFIVENCINDGAAVLAPRITERIEKMNRVNGITNVKEVQIDCDWTAKSQNDYYALLRELRPLLAKRGLGLSATIRLHQLDMAPPPVDYGALMVYNTGDLRINNGHNPILDMRDVKPYLHKLKRYDLPLCAAYPSFAWNLLFKGNEFRAILYDADLTDTITFSKCGKNRHLVTAQRTFFNHMQDDGNDIRLSIGDSVITHLPTAQQVIEIHNELSSKRQGINNQVIIYSLNNKNINYYKPDDYEKIYSP